MKYTELKEKVNHGTKEFPIEVYHANGLFASYHWHDECEFIYITSGSACIRIGVNNFELKQGECAFVKSNALHSISAEDNTKLGFYAVVFHPSLILSDFDICKKYLSTRYLIQNQFSRRGDEIYIIETLIQLCRTYEEKDFAYELKVKSHLYSIFSHIFEHGFFHEAKNNEGKKASDRLEKVIKYIHAHCLSPVTVEELAQVSGYSVSHFTHFFKKLTGKTPIEYIIRQRIYHACNMLKGTDLSVLEVSFACGFEHVGYFIKTFKKITGYTPLKYKKK